MPTLVHTEYEARSDSSAHAYLAVDDLMVMANRPTYETSYIFVHVFLPLRVIAYGLVRTY